VRVLTAIGARPQLIKAAPLSAALQAAGVDEVIVHSGQHYDHGMSQLFFDELQLPAAQLNLGVGSGPHGRQTGQMLERFEAAIQQYQPDIVLVHGDTNSTLAAALAAAKLGVRLAHNEAGLRSFDRTMPEEHNRVLTDHCADLLFCPNASAREQLAREGVTRGVHVVGDVMYDAALQFASRAEQQSQILERLGLAPRAFMLATLHRPLNVDREDRLGALLRAFGASGSAVVLPAHPRLLAKLQASALSVPDNVRVIAPVGYLDMIMLEKSAQLVLTDSGGVQKEAYFYGVPCLTLRAQTEWTETVETGWNRLVDADESRIAHAIAHCTLPGERPPIFGDGRAALAIVEIMLRSAP
jgi:UDP-GlcNAc3NAcA epimerase